MTSTSAIDELESSISKHYESYSARKVALAAFLVGVFTIGLSYTAYALTNMTVAAIIVFGLSGVFSVYLSMIFIVPPSTKLNEARELICAAIREPSRIKAFDIKGVKLADKEGNVQTLSGFDLMVWRTMVVPYFVQSQAAGRQPAKVKTDRRMTASERKYIEDQRREVLEIKKTIDEERIRMEKERKEMESRITELQELEKTASDKLAKVESVKMEEIEEANAKREAEIARREAELQERQRKIDIEAKDLEERNQYVSSVEDALVDRLNELTAREAGIEQTEINVGLRND